MHKFIMIIFCVGICILFTSCTSGQAVFVDKDADEGDLLSVDDSVQITNEDYSGNENNTETLYSENVAVYVCGAVVNPGVYYLVPDSIKQDALAAAGGFAEGAAECYINLAESIQDGEKIYVPYEDELSSGYTASGDESEASDKVNINTATAEVLMTLPGIGESKANAIIKYRNQNGAFDSIEEIKNINGIKEGVYDNIKDLIVVN